MRGNGMYVSSRFVSHVHIDKMEGVQVVIGMK